MKKLFIIAVLLAGLSAQAQQITEQRAREIAREFFGLRTSVQRRQSVQSMAPQKAYEAEGQRLFVFNNPDNTGFVIVAGDERAESPILGWSDNGPFDYDKASCGLKALLAQYAEGIRRYESRGYEKPKYTPRKSEANVVVGPLLTTRWGQDAPFYNDCPVNGNGEHYVTGCLPTAVAQIMNYWQWPRQGSGQHTNDCYPSQHVDFSASTYDWEHMKDFYGDPWHTEKYTDQEAAAVAKLMSDVGCAANALYGGSGGTSAYLENAYRAMFQHFGYEEDGQFYGRNAPQDDDTWDDKLRAELDNHRPILYSGGYFNNSHAFVCDGYDDAGYFHFNFGWHGTDDGYYKTSSITSSNYESFSQIITGIRPRNYQKVCIDGVFYDVTGADEVTVSSSDGNPEYEGEVVIPEQVTIDGKPYRVTAMRPQAFSHYIVNGNVTGNSMLTGITLPGSLQQINDAAFYRCDQLQNVVLGNGIKRIGASAFSECKQLKTLTMSEDVEEIGDDAFNACWELQGFTMSQNIRRIGNGAFCACLNLSTIGYNWGDQLEYVGDNAFAVCKNLSSIPTFPATTMYIGDGAFKGLKNIGWISFKAKGFTIGERAFSQSGVSNASGLDGAAKIGRYSGIDLSGEFTVQPTCVYEEGALSAETVVLPAALESFDKNTIYCKGTFRVEEGNKHYASANGVLYSKDLQTLIRCPVGALNGNSWFTIPAGVKKLEPESMNSNIYYVTIPASVKEMNGAFSNLTDLRGVACLATSPTAISDNTFANIHEYGRSVLDVPFGSKQAYAQANEWKRFNNINETVAVTDKFCYSVSDEYGTAQVIGRNTEVAFDGKADIPASMTCQGKTYTVNGADLPGDGFITSLSLPETCAGYTGDFRGCVNLQTLTLPNSIQYISNGSFKDCPKLANVSLGSGLEWIFGQAFQNCTRLKSITIPDKVFRIEDRVFENCGLEKVTFQATDYSINEKAFNGCQSLRQAPGLENARSIGEKAFSGCAFTGDLSFSTSLQSISYEAFENNDIATVTLPSTLGGFSNDAFNGNPNFHSYIVNGTTGDYYTQDDMLFRHSENWEDGSPIDELLACPPMKKEGSSIVHRYDVVVPEGTNVIRAELGRIGVRHVTLPASLTQLQYPALGTAFDLYSVTVKATTPLEIDDWAFSPSIFNRPSLTLYVPKGCISVYRAAPYWEQFPNIREIGDVPTNIKDNNQYTITNNPSGADAVYDLQGRRLDNGYCRSGVYIVNGRKVVVR